MTNQNDTQDEAERLAAIYIFHEFRGSSDERDELFMERATIYKDGYRAGQSSPETMSRFLHEQRMAQVEKELAASRAEVERLKSDINSAADAAMIHGTNHDNLSDAYLVLRKQLAAEKSRSQKLVEAMDMTTRLLRADRMTGVDSREAIENELLECLSAYSTDSGDGGKG